MAPETLAQIEAAEAAGGFEGGMSGASGEGGFSAEGSTGENSSFDSSSPHPDLREVSRQAQVIVDGIFDAVLGIRDLVLGILGHAAGPVILVPKREMERLLNGGSGDEA